MHDSTAAGNGTLYSDARLRLRMALRLAWRSCELEECALLALYCFSLGKGELLSGRPHMQCGPIPPCSPEVGMHMLLDRSSALRALIKSAREADRSAVGKVLPSQCMRRAGGP